MNFLTVPWGKRIKIGKADGTKDKDNGIKDGAKDKENGIKDGPKDKENGIKMTAELR